MIVHHINLAGCLLRGKLIEEVEERNEDGGCHEDQEFLFSCLLSITQMMLSGFDDYRSCVEE